MKCCTFCSRKEEMLFSHLVHHVGLLCVECYMKLQASCGTCSSKLVPDNMSTNVDYQVQAKFISMRRRNIIVCDQCHDAVREEFPQMFT